MDVTRWMRERVRRRMAQATRWRAEATRDGVSSTAHSREQFWAYTAALMGTDDLEATVPAMPPGLLVRIGLLREVAPSLVRSFYGIYRASHDLRHNPPAPRRSITAGELATLEDEARGWGARLVGYTEVEPDWVFAGRTVLDKNVIVLGVEGEADVRRAIEKGRNQVQTAIADLGVLAIRVARHLRSLGFAAQAGPALGGDAAYPPLAMKAGLGWIGRNGLLLTEEFGPRVRLAVVYCSADDLPFHDPSERRFAWMEDYCAGCGKCIARCPPQALAEEATVRPNGAKVHVDPGRCYPYFEANFGCGVCVEVCPFSFADVAKLKQRAVKNANATSSRP